LLGMFEVVVSCVPLFLIWWHGMGCEAGVISRMVWNDLFHICGAPGVVRHWVEPIEGALGS
jgi:hypothetical protein